MIDYILVSKETSCRATSIKELLYCFDVPTTYIWISFNAIGINSKRFCKRQIFAHNYSFLFISKGFILIARVELTLHVNRKIFAAMR